MRVRVMAAVMLMLVCLAVAQVAFAAGIEGQAGQSNTAILKFAAVCPMHPNAWGRITYTLSGPTLDFVFNGHVLPMTGDYKLYAGGVLLGSTTATGAGNVHIQGAVAGSTVLQGAVFELRHTHSMDGQQHECVVLRSDANGYTFAP